jgi:replicative DNA helicase
MADEQLDALKTPPHSVEAEQSVIGGLLLENEALDKVADILTANDFYRHDHKAIFQHIAKLIEHNRPADIVTVAESLESTAELSGIGGIAYLGALAHSTPTAANIRRYAEIVHERAVMRQLVVVGSGIAESAYAPNGRDAQQLLDEAEAKIFQIAEGGKRSSQGFVDIKVLLPQVADRIDQLFSRDNPSDVTGVPTGFADLDSMTSGMQGGDLIIVAGRPSMGKTALSLSFVMSAASFDYTVGFVSLEMGAEQISLRLLSSCARVRLASLRSAQLSAEDWSSITSAAAKLARKKIFIDDTASQTVSDIRTKARKLKIEHNIKLLVIDYLQLISPTKKHDSRQQEVSEISRSLKILAKDLGIPIIALSQLSRGVESRIDKRPLLSDLRDSGAIEQDADLIMFLYRDSVYNAGEQSHEGTAEIILGKQRNGPTGTMHIKYLKEFTLFHE